MNWSDLITAIAGGLVIVIGAIGAFYKIFVEKSEKERESDLTLAEHQAKLLIEPLSKQLEKNEKRMEELEYNIKKLEDEIAVKNKYVYAWELSSKYINSIIIWISNTIDNHSELPEMPTELKDFFKELNEDINIEI